METRSIVRTVVLVVLIAAVAYGLLLVGIAIAGLFGEGEETSLTGLRTI